MQPIRCINPVCSHVFSAAEVAKATVLRCPRCGQQIQFRPNTPPAPARPKAAAPAVPPAKPPTVPTARPAAKPPAASPVQTAKPKPPPAPSVRPAVPPPPPPPPVTAAPAPEPAADDYDPLGSFGADAEGGPLLPESIGSGRGGGKTLLTMLAIAFIFLGSILVAFLLMRRLGDKTDEEKGPASRGVEQAYMIRNFQSLDETPFKIVLPKEQGWQPDDELRKKLKATTAWRDSAAGAWLVVAVSDFGLQKPRDAELMQLGTDHLRALYGETLEVDLPMPSKVGPLPAQKLMFKGRDGKAINLGEMHMLSHKGLAYLVVFGGKTMDVAQQTYQSLQDGGFGVEFLESRKSWVEQPPPMTIVTSLSGRITFKVPQGVYEKASDPKLSDPLCDMLLLGRYRKEKDNLKNATIQVLLMEPEKDLDAAMKTAKDHVLAGWMSAEAKGYQLVVSPDVEEKGGEMGKEATVAGRPGRVGDFCLMIGDKRERFVAIGIVSEADHVVVICCDVVWDNRQIWHQEFHDLIAAAQAPG